MKGKRLSATGGWMGAAAKERQARGGGWKGGWKIRLERKTAESPEGAEASNFSDLLGFSWSRRSGLNRRPADYETVAAETGDTAAGEEKGRTGQASDSQTEWQLG